MKNIYKLFSILLVLIFNFSTIFAQLPNVTVSADSLLLIVTAADSDGNGDSSNGLEVVLTNESSENIPLKWEKRVITNSQPTWLFHVCDENACYLPQVNSAEVNISHSGSQGPIAGWTSFKLSFDDNLNTLYDGYAEVELKISLVNDPSKFVNVLFIFDGQSVTSSVDVEKLTPLTLFPNPSHDFINISGEYNSNASQTIVYGMNGQVALQTSYKHDEAIDITNISSGVYVLAILDSNNNVLARERFSKL